MNYIKHLVIVFLLGIAVSSCNQKPNVTAEIKNLGDDTILVEYAPVSQFYKIDEPLRDTLFSTNGKFSFNSSIDEPIIAFFFPQKAAYNKLDGHPYHPTEKHLTLFIEPDDQITVNGELFNYYLAYEATGSDINKDYAVLRSDYIKETSESVKLELKIDTLISNRADEESINNLYKKRNEIIGIGKKAELNFIKHNFDKSLSGYLLSRQKLDTLGKYYDRLEPTVKNGMFKPLLDVQHTRYQKFLKVKKAQESIVPGNEAPDFTLQSLSGADFSLSSITDKVIILDFWGSWCGWCMKGVPRMKEYYNKYKEKIEIIGIACNDTEEKWKKTVKENNMNWIQLINNKEMDKDVSVMYGVQGYPTKIILNKDKEILDVFVGESEDFYKELDKLLK